MSSPIEKYKAELQAMLSFDEGMAEDEADFREYIDFDDGFTFSHAEKSRFIEGARHQHTKTAKIAQDLLDALEALEGLLTNVALDWYVEMFARDEKPQGASTGITAKIHNRALNQRAYLAFQKAREILAKLSKGDE